MRAVQSALCRRDCNTNLSILYELQVCNLKWKIGGRLLGSDWPTGNESLVYKKVLESQNGTRKNVVTLTEKCKGIFFDIFRKMQYARYIFY